MRLFKTFSLLLISAIMIISCGDNNQLENDNYYIHNDNYYIHVDPVTIEAPVEGGEFDIHIEANVPDIWILKSDSDFISAEQMSASTYSEQLLYVYPNNTGSARIGSATVSASGCQNVTITVLQKGENEGSGGGGSTQINAPSGLHASASGNTISLSWNSVSGASYYQVYYSSTSSNPRNYLDYTYETSYSYTVNSPGTYYFAVMAIGSDGNESSYSDSASCTVSGSGGSGGSGGNTTTRPSTPSGVKAVLNGEKIIVSWNASSGAEYYRVYYDRPSPYSGATFENCYQTSMTFYPKTIYGVWTFWIVAVSSDYQTSDASSKVTLNYSSGGSGGGSGGGQTQLNTPQNLEAYSGYSFVQISFDSVPAAYDYYLYRSTSPNSGYSKITASGGSSGNRYTLTDQNPKNGTTYYKVKAIALSSTGIKDSEYSSYVKVTR